MKIVVMGYSGAGKSTLARALGERYNVPVLHFDTVYWAPNCQRHLKMSFSAEIECHFSLGSIQVYTALITGPLVGLKPVKS